MIFLSYIRLGQKMQQNATFNPSLSSTKDVLLQVLVAWQFGGFDKVALFTVVVDSIKLYLFSDQNLTRG